MSEQAPPSGPGGLPDQSQRRFAPAAARARRAASVTIRQDDAEADQAGSLMDPATQSLSDALRITYRLVILAVFALIGLYLLSGFRSVGEGESGIRVIFGKPQAEDLGPGFRFSWPEPFGELVKVKTGAQAINIDDDFFPELTADEKKKVSTEGTQFLSNGGKDALSPETDGSLITADGNIAHTRWAASYHRARPRQFEENVYPEQEKAIVKGAICRGIVRAAGSVTIDELLKNTGDPSRKPGEFRTVEAIARDVAQKTLDDMRTGITIDVLSMTQKIPPRRVMSAFNTVQSSQSEAQTEVDDARTEYNTKLTDTAGNAYRQILEQIDRYEKKFELKEQKAADDILATIDGLMAGETVTIDGQQVQPVVFGRVTGVLEDAKRYRSSLINRLESETYVFNAKRESFTQNAGVLLTTDFASALSSFLKRPSVQMELLPDATGWMVVTINPDPAIAKGIEADRNERKAKEAEKARREQQERDRFEQKNRPSGGRTTG